MTNVVDSIKSGYKKTIEKYKFKTDEYETQIKELQSIIDIYSMQSQKLASDQ